MKKTLLLTLATAVSALALEPEQSQFQMYPKNLARQHMGTNLFQYSPTTQAYSPTQAAAAWLDDDITTGWAMMGGKQYYLLCFPEAEMMTSFGFSAKPASGSVSLYAGEEAAPPGAKSWSLLAKDLPFESLNERKLDKSFSRTAKYLLIETNLTDPGPIYSLYVYGDRPATSYSIETRQQAIKTQSIFGPYANDATAFSLTGLYAHSYVQPQNGATNLIELQKAIDDNPETTVTLGGGQPSTLQIRESEARQVSRIAMEVSPGAKGRFEFFLRNGGAVPASNAALTSTTSPTTNVIPAATIATTTATPATTGATPVATIVLDGSSSRASVEFASASAEMVEAVWTPANGTDSVSVHEVNAFNGMTLANSMVISNTADPIAESPEDSRRKSRDGKEVADYKDGKDYKADPIAALEQGPYLPGALGFPPLLTARALRGPRTPSGNPPPPTVLEPPQPPPVSP